MLALGNRLLRLLPIVFFITACVVFLLVVQEADQGGNEIFLPQESIVEVEDATEAAWREPMDDELDDESLFDMEADLEAYEKEMDFAFDDEGADDDEYEGINSMEEIDEDAEDDIENGDDVVPSFTRLNNSALYLSSDGTDWSKFAYVQYVTDVDYLCNSVMAFETLGRLGSRADRVMMYPSEMLAPDAEYSDTKAGQLLIKARDEYNVKLQPIEIQRREGDDLTWAESFTKLLAFNQTQYDRVLSLDSDGMVLQPMDELFHLPSCPVAMPRAYWLYHDENPSKVLSSQLMVVQPNEIEFERIIEKMETIDRNDYDMEIVNELYLDSALVLPHRKYNMLSAEFRRDNHTDYLGSDREKWDPIAAFNEAKFVHFSDWPVPKPWIQDLDLRQEHEPKCRMVDEELSCIEREIWNKLYTDFALIRKRVCMTVDKTPEKKKKQSFWSFSGER
ncbi:hypothetical protein FPOA_08800 [Fusarium poae]|uniref:Glucose N-acetyltransferase 1 n=1 Tax=Fusarium poae TaxID=36050 RepID=A0A1B8API0_FUSPO|nr:hypothetical protein FPOA_08800 [Fusarium poae]